MTDNRLGRFAAGLALGLVGLVALASPAAAQSSTSAELINGLNGKLLYVAVPITIFVEVILVYAILKFKDSDEAEPTKENRRLEITWTVATAIVLLFVGVASTGVLADDSVTYMGTEPPDDAVHVEANAFQWNWNMNYPDQGIESLTASDVDLPQAEGLSGPLVVVPKGEPVYFTVTSEDVIHSFAVSDLGLKQDAVPGQTNTIKTTPLETGVYQGHCTEFCGAGHSQMNFNVIVVEQDTYQQFIEAQTDGGSANVDSDSN